MIMENDILTRALTTSDFPNLMANIPNRTLRKITELAERTYKPITKRNRCKMILGQSYSYKRVIFLL